MLILIQAGNIVGISGFFLIDRNIDPFYWRMFGHQNSVGRKSGILGIFHQFKKGISVRLHNKAGVFHIFFTDFSPKADMLKKQEFFSVKVSEFDTFLVCQSVSCRHRNIKMLINISLTEDIRII